MSVGVIVPVVKWSREARKTTIDFYVNDESGRSGSRSIILQQIDLALEIMFGCRPSGGYGVSCFCRPSCRT